MLSIRKILPLLIPVIELCLPMGRAWGQDLKLAVVCSDSIESTRQTIKGIKNTISSQYQTVAFYEFVLPAEPISLEKNMDQIAELNPRLIFTVGTSATKIVSERFKDRPIIFSAVLNPEISGFVRRLDRPGGNITGSSLDIAPDIQFNYFKRVIKKLRKIGVLYSSETENLIPPAKALASAVGLELMAIKVEAEKEIPEAMLTLNRSVDGIWSVADSRIFTPNSTRFILLNTLRNGKPLMGFSRNLVESGALFALDFDYSDIGKQAGQIALEVLAGKSPSTIPVAVPEIFWFNYNEKTARYIRVKIPEDLAVMAKEVFR